MRHFHLDLFGNYLPGLCSGLALRRDDLGAPLNPEHYPLLTTLYNAGINGLFELAAGYSGFEPSDRYLNKCHLCLELRRHLHAAAPGGFEELQPAAFYENL